MAVTGAKIYTENGDLTSITVAGESFSGTAKTWSEIPVPLDKFAAVVGQEFSTGVQEGTLFSFQQIYGSSGFKYVTFTGCTNSTSNYSGVLYAYQHHLYVENTLFKNNRTAGRGGAAYISSWESRFVDTVFDGNTAADLGGALWTAASIYLSGLTFRNNAAANGGGALWLNGSVSVTLSAGTSGRQTVFEANKNAVGGYGTFTIAEGATAEFRNDTGNAVSATTLVVAGTAVFSGNAFAVLNNNLTVTGTLKTTAFSDRVKAQTAITLDGAYLELASHFESPSITVTDTDFVFNNSSSITLSGLTFTDTASTLSFTGAVVNFTAQDLSAATLDFYGGTATARRIAATGVTALDTVKVDGVARAVNTIYLINNDTGIQRVVYDANKVEVHTGAFIKLKTSGNGFDELSDPADIYAGYAGRIEAVSGTHTLSGRSFSGLSDTLGGAICVDSGATLTVRDSIFSRNDSPAAPGGGDGTGGGIRNGGMLYLSGTTFAENTGNQGGALFVVGGHTATVVANSGGRDTVFTGNRNAVAGWGQFIIAEGAAAEFTADTGNAVTVHTVRIDGEAAFNGNKFGILNYYITVTGTLTTATYSDRIKAQTAITLDGAYLELASHFESPSITVTDTDFVFNNRTNAIDVSKLTFTDTASAMTFAGTQAVRFSEQDLSAVKLTVDGSRFAAEPVTIATGVTAIGDYAIDGGSDHLRLKVADTNLVLYLKGDVEEGDVEATFIGGTSNLMTGGTVTGAFFGTSNASGDVTTTISGGTVGNAVIGGAKVAKGNTAALTNVTLNIAGGELAGGPDNGGQLYTAGYAYGASESALDANVTLSVAKSELNLTGGSIAAENLFAGAHARKGAWTHVTDTVVTVTDGVYHRIYGGGWAELNGRSVVNAAAITVSGGTVERIYAGGANAAGGETVTGSATISVGGSASVDFIFLAGKNANCSVTNGAAATLSGDAKSLVRISGRNGNGSDNTSGVTSLTVATNTTVDYLDYVDKLNLTQGTMLNIVELAQYEHGSDATLNFLTDGSAGEWTALSGAGFELFQSAQFQVNGEAVLRNSETGALGSSGYKLEFTDDKFIITKLA